MPADLVIAGEIPPVPFVLLSGQFMEALELNEWNATHLDVTDEKTAQQAADLQRDLTSAGQALERERKRLIAPFVDFQREINAASAAPGQRIEVAKARLRSKLGSWQEKERARLAQIERDRQTELDRLRKKKDEEDRAAAESARKALEASKPKALAPAAAVPIRRLNLVPKLPPPPPKSETQVAIERLEHAPAPVAAAKPAGVRFVTRLKHKVIDMAVLPEPFVIRTPDDKKIRETFCVGFQKGDDLPICPGVEFISETTSESM